MVMWKFRKSGPIGVHLTRTAAWIAQLRTRGDEVSVSALATVDLRDLPQDQDDAWDAEASRRIGETLSRHHFSGTKGVCCLAGEELNIQNLRLPQLPPDELAGAIELEAQERLTTPLQQMEIRYLKAGEIRQESHIKQEMILIAAPHELVRRRIRILEQAGLETVAVELEPLAVLRCHLRQSVSGESKGSSTAYVHIGEEGPSVLFSDGVQLSFLKTISIGSRLLDESVAKHLGVEMPEASRMRSALQSVNELDPHDEIHRSIIEAIRQPLESLCVETELCLRYHKVTYRNRPIGEVVLTGGETCGWLGEYFQARLGMNCRLSNPFSGMKEQLRISQRERAGGWITSMGMAMRPFAKEEFA